MQKALPPLLSHLCMFSATIQGFLQCSNTLKQTIESSESDAINEGSVHHQKYHYSVSAFLRIKRP